ncbi:MAG TPA: TetR/AcrR family transcriptional regulator [Ktedonobacteraceae bacterium]|jgi:AcrR family transcriptional regulator|nr:TetR/AcrR family transcriptional regulator [Ktedonobacteraceae bacterium]
MIDDMQRLPLRERNRRRIYRQIVDAAFELFRASGFDATTMDAIAEKAEVSRGTLFNYFPTKDSLLMPFANELYNQYVQPEVRTYLDKQPATLDVIRFLFIRIYEHILTLPGIDRALRHEFFSFPRQPDDCKIGTGFFDTLRSIVQYGQRRGEVRADIPLENLARYIGVLYVPLLKEVRQSTAAKYAGEVDTLLAFLRSALCP